jgi:hypothetical protein
MHIYATIAKAKWSREERGTDFRAHRKMIHMRLCICWTDESSLRLVYEGALHGMPLYFTACL